MFHSSESGNKIENYHLTCQRSQYKVRTCLSKIFFYSLKTIRVIMPIIEHPPTHDNWTNTFHWMKHDY